MNDAVLTRDSDAGFRFSWTAIIIGALSGAALSSIFVSFGVAVGLGVSSASPTWRDASVALWLLSGLYLVVQGLVSFAIAGYVAGWLSVPRASAAIASEPVHSPDTVGTRPAIQDTDMHDGLHGIAAWALAILIGAFFAAMIAGAAVQGSSFITSGARTSVAEPMLSYELDRLFRAPRRGANADLTAERAEAGRILMTASSHRGVVGDDRSYLVQLVAGAGAPDAERRVDAAIENTRQAIRRSRAGGIIAAFSIASALLLGAVAAWMAAGSGARHRRGELPAPRWMSGSSVRQM